jgi:hypothetical protein
MQLKASRSKGTLNDRFDRHGKFSLRTRVWIRRKGPRFSMWSATRADERRFAQKIERITEHTDGGNHEQLHPSRTGRCHFFQNHVWQFVKIEVQQIHGIGNSPQLGERCEQILSQRFHAFVFRIS